ncbi:hypothetical protein PF003_g21046 [Phytophthora fragariae]|nr:hypothetical protein PF003_g21046 [Phytophthora fragariae]
MLSCDTVHQGGDNAVSSLMAWIASGLSAVGHLVIVKMRRVGIVVSVGLGH